MMENEIKSTEGFGIASMILGIISLLLFCTCINWITGILAIIFGIIQLTKKSAKGFAVAGIITAALSILFAILLYVEFAVGMAREGLSYDDFYDSYYDSYYDDYYDYYDYDSYYDNYYDEYFNDYYDGYYDDYDSYYDYYDDYYDYYDDYDGYYDYEESGPEFLNF